MSFTKKIYSWEKKNLKGDTGNSGGGNAKARGWVASGAPRQAGSRPRAGGPGVSGASPGPGLIHSPLQEYSPPRFTSGAVSFIIFFTSMDVFIHELVTER